MYSKRHIQRVEENHTGEFVEGHKWNIKKSTLSTSLVYSSTSSIPYFSGTKSILISLEHVNIRSVTFPKNKKPISSEHY